MDIYTCMYSQASSRPPAHHPWACMYTYQATHTCMHPPTHVQMHIYPSIYLSLRACIARPAANRPACSAVSRRLAASVEKRASAGQPPPIHPCILCWCGPAMVNEQQICNFGAARNHLNPLRGSERGMLEPILP